MLVVQACIATVNSIIIVLKHIYQKADTSHYYFFFNLKFSENEKKKTKILRVITVKFYGENGAVRNMNARHFSKRKRSQLYFTNIRSNEKFRLPCIIWVLSDNLLKVCRSPL